MSEIGCFTGGISVRGSGGDEEADGRGVTLVAVPEHREVTEVGKSVKNYATKLAVWLFWNFK